ncbi:hypothetical protein LCGC14_1111900 [marine sediment metagenome]|uniref:Uncharacterized protein n=1 Tax=marine sediment metagenome TaxID=412755 RepID=A0A0F9MB87_9ZZZZ
MVNKKEKTRENYQVSIGPTMKKVVEKQKQNVREVTKNVCNPSNWEVMEILANKILDNDLV